MTSRHGFIPHRRQCRSTHEDELSLSPLTEDAELSGREYDPLGPPLLFEPEPGAAEAGETGVRPPDEFDFEPKLLWSDTILKGEKISAAGDCSFFPETVEGVDATGDIVGTCARPAGEVTSGELGNIVSI